MAKKGVFSVIATIAIVGVVVGVFSQTVLRDASVSTNTMTSEQAYADLNSKTKRIGVQEVSVNPQQLDVSEFLDAKDELPDIESSYPFVIAGNGDVNTEEQKARIEQLLNEKYGDTFVVQSMERQTAQMAFTKAHYLAQVSSDAYPGQFRARVDTDFNEVADDYPRLYWNEEIEHRVAQVEKTMPENCDAQWDIIYRLSGQTWKNTDSIEDYLMNGITYVHFTVETNAIDVADTALALREALQAQNLQYTTTWKLDGTTVTFGEMQGQTLTPQEICAKFERAAS